MSLELINTLATLGTFLVIAATAIAAIVQLRHARSSYHIAALTELRETTETPNFQAALHFVQTQLTGELQNPDFRYQVVHIAARTAVMRPLFGMVRAIGNFYEGVGVLVRTGLVDGALVMQIYAHHIMEAWEKLAPVVAIARRKSGDVLWENFEYVTVLAQDWIAAHPKGTYPADVRRIDLKDEWLEADKQYAASLSPA